MSSPQPVDSRQVDLQQPFRRALPNTVAALRRLAEQLRASPSAGEVLEALHKEVLRVQGTAGGHELGRLAGRLAERVQRWSSDPGIEAAQRCTMVEHFASALQLELAQGDAAPALHIRRRLLLLGAPEVTVNAIRDEGALHGYDVVAEDLANVGDAIARTHPDAISVVAGDVDAAVRVIQDADIPLIILHPADAAERTSYAGTVAFDVSAGLSAFFEVVERLALGRSQAGATILVVDDDPSILTLVRYAIESPEIHVVTLDDASRLEKHLDTLQPSLLVLDVHLTGYNGVALTRSLRVDERFEELPIILFSSDASSESRAAAFDAGADEFLSKPIVPAELKARIHDRLEAHRLARLAEGLHPVTGFATGARASRELIAAIRDVERRGLAASVVMMRPTSSTPGEEAPGSWYREALRLRRSLPELELMAHGTPPVIAGVFSTHAENAITSLETLAAMIVPMNPEWRAGIVDSLSMGNIEPTRLIRAAEDALTAALAKEGELVHRWTGDEPEIAPDVVIIEEDARVADMLEFAVTSAGFSARRFGTGPEALDALRAMHTGDRHPLLLMDVDLPGLDGHTLHERIRLERPGVFSAVMMTAHVTEAEQIRALRSGALDYLGKPLNLRVLAAKLPNWLRSAGTG